MADDYERAAVLTAVAKGKRQQLAGAGRNDTPYAIMHQSMTRQGAPF